MNNKKGPLPMANTSEGQKHAQEIDKGVQQTKNYGGHVGTEDPGEHAQGQNSEGGFTGTGGQGGAGRANYSTTDVNDAPGPDAGPDSPGN